VEEAQTKTLFGNPQHPYTMGLLKSIPVLGDKIRRGKVRLNEIPGVVPSLYELPSGCKFSTRCPFVMDICREKEPELKEIEKSHFSSCWLANQ
jgi:oligopeptide/dipeptide ABC transporter ATP-binding protein